MRDTITLACQTCKQRNYTTTKNKKTVPHKLELKNIVLFVNPIRLIKKPSKQASSSNGESTGLQIRGLGVGNPSWPAKG